LAGVSFIEYKNHRILQLDFSYCQPEEVLALIREGAETIRTQPEKSLLTLTKTEGSKFDSEVVKAMKEFTKENEPYVRAAAIVGLKGLQKIVLEAVRLFTKREFGVFEDEDRAKEYLVGKGE
jgi:hypothetical protein